MQTERDGATETARLAHTRLAVDARAAKGLNSPPRFLRFSDSSRTASSRLVRCTVS
jgi:hypothetical protein